jgi:copper(I)-binding protein
MKTFALTLLLLLASPAYAQGKVEIQNPWSRATPPGATLAAGYLVITNKGGVADRLVGGSSPLAARVETHVTLREGEVMKMRPVKGYDVPAGGSFEAKPGGAHLMFVGIKQPFKVGDKVPATLRFEKAGEVKVEFAVLNAPPAAAGHPAGGHQMH